MSRVVEELQADAQRDGVGLTLAELEAVTGRTLPEVRRELSLAVFVDKAVTCVVPPYQKGRTPKPGRYMLGDPGSLLTVQ